MKPAASKTVCRVIPINANDAAFLRVIAGSYAHCFVQVKTRKRTRKR
jgi:hypothetical protein